MDSDHSSNTSSSTDHSPTTAARFSVSSPTSSQASSAASSPGTHKRRAGRKKFRETRHPVYRGVRERNGGKWVCEVREPQKKTRIWLGTYTTPEMAARAHDVAALALRGESAPLNFPDSVWAIPRAASSSVEDIRLAAAEAAERYRPAWAAAAGPGTSVSPRQRRLSGAVAPAAVEEPAPAVREAPAGSGEVAAGFLDEEALFNMPGLLASMAEGMLLTPPGALQRGFDWDDVDGYVDMSLWRH